MTKGLVRSLSRGTAQRQDVIKATIAFKALAIAVVDGAPGYGTAVIGDFPQGNILVLGATSYAQFTTADADITATYDGFYAIGTAPTADGTLSGAEVAIIPSTALGAATAKVSPIVRGVSTANGTIYDNTDGSLELNLALLIADAGISGAAGFTVTGSLTIAYIVLGDD